MEKTIKKDIAYHGKVMDLEIHTVVNDNGTLSKREIAKLASVVVILGITIDNKIILIKQYRKAIEEECLELPAGRVELGEEYITAAIREFREETGYILTNYKKLTEYYSSPGFTNERMIFFIGYAKDKGKTEFDEDEYIESYEFTLEELKSMIEKGIISDGKTILGIYMYESISRS
ncbi:MAG: NUDIX hydrolase [Filifactoraceae bacterium]